MRKTYLLLLFSFLSLNIQAQSYSEFIKKGDALYASTDYSASLDAYQQAFKIKKDNPSDLYNAACSAALSENTRSAYKLLNMALEAGWTNARHLQKDSDLASLHGSKKWDKTVAKCQKELDKIEANYNKPLQQELLTIFSDDQNIRHLYIDSGNENGWEHPTTDSLGRIMLKMDSINEIKIINILNEHGWVGSDLVGGQANQAIFLVIQHADIDTQKKYLPMMREAVAGGNASSRSLALLEDRVALREGRKQIYGSQIGRNQETDEQYVLPLEDPDNVDNRRADMGLGTIADYISRWNLTWDATAYKKRLSEYEAWYWKKE